VQSSNGTKERKKRMTTSNGGGEARSLPSRRLQTKKPGGKKRGTSVAEKIVPGWHQPGSTVRARRGERPQVPEERRGWRTTKKSAGGPYGFCDCSVKSVSSLKSPRRRECCSNAHAATRPAGRCRKEEIRVEKKLGWPRSEKRRGGWGDAISEGGDRSTAQSCEVRRRLGAKRGRRRRKSRGRITPIAGRSRKRLTRLAKETAWKETRRGKEGAPQEHPRRSKRQSNPSR